MLHGSTQISTPLTAVLNLQSAESVNDFEAALRYIDVEMVYSRDSEESSPYEEWRRSNEFFHSLSQSEKFTNCFKYFKFRISEELIENRAKVYFTPIENDDSTRKITYELELRGERWIVVGISCL